MKKAFLSLHAIKREPSLWKVLSIKSTSLSLIRLWGKVVYNVEKSYVDKYWKLLKESVVSPKPKNISVDLFDKYFKAINNPEDPFFQADDDILYYNERFLNEEAQVMFDELNVDITSNEIQKAISQLKQNRSGGPDGFLNELFIHGSTELLPYLLELFNKILIVGYFPEVWSEGYIVPIHKKGKLDDVNNFRGITLLSTLGKLFTRILNNRLTKWAEEYAIYIEAQAGFRANMSTTDNIYVLHGLINHFINRVNRLYCAFVDFTKAFDYVNRDVIWYKLIKIGVRGKILNVIKSMYEHVKSRVKINNVVSEGFESNLGVRQGECLSPFLFAMYLNDLEDVYIQKGYDGIDIGLIKLFLLLYADDIILFAASADELQMSLDILHDYSNRWKLKVDTDKTKILVFRKGGILNKNLAFYYDNVQLEIFNKFSYLGVVFSSGESFTECQSKLAGQAQKAIFKLNNYLYKFTNITPRHRLELFDKLVTPILNYSCEVWGFCKADKIERVHMHFCKQVLGVKFSTQNDFIYGELGRVSYYTRRLFCIIKYWFKIINADNRRYIKHVYKLMLEDLDQNPNIKNWASFVKNTLSNSGFYHVWLTQGVGDIKIFLKIFKQRLQDNFVQEWHHRLNDSSRALFYREIASFDCKNYLDVVNVRKFRTALTKLRTSSHRLEIEVGRWARPQSIARKNRKCKFCNKLEDEFHFIIECTLFRELRISYIKPYFIRGTSMYKTIQLLKSTNKTDLKNLACYIYKGFKKRKEVLLNDVRN